MNFHQKHAAAVTALYAGTAILGNVLLGKKVPERAKITVPYHKVLQDAPKTEVFHGILAGMYSFDMSATYLFLDHLKKQCNEKGNI